MQWESVLAYMQVLPQAAAGYYDAVGFLLYLVFNELRYRKNGNGATSGGVKELGDRLGLLALQGAALLVRVDVQERKVGDIENTAKEYRKEFRDELRAITERVAVLERIPPRRAG